MKNKKHFLLEHPVIKWGVIPLLLFFFSLILLLVVNLLSNNSGFLVLTQNHSTDSLITNNTDELLKNEKIRGEFTARNNNLGIVSLRFTTFNRINNDLLQFRIREKGAKSWYYRNTYKVDQFQNNHHFPFGFPSIQDSRGKTYVYEIESLKGKRGDAVAVNTDHPVFITHYQYTKNALFSDMGELSRFLILKYESFLHNGEYMLLSFSPLFLYVFWRLLRFISMVKFLVLLSFILVIFYIFFAGRILSGDKLNSAPFIILLLGIWVVILKRYKVESSFYFLLSLFFLALMSFILLLMNRPDIAGRSAIFAYAFLLIGTIDSIYALLLKTKRASTERFLTEIVGSSVILQLQNALDSAKKTFLQRMQSLILLLFGNKPRSGKKVVLFVFRAMIVVLSIFITSYILVNSSKRVYTMYDEKKTIQSRTPVITRIEPSIVYYATKVVILGEGFGEGDKNIKLMKYNEEVKADFWSDKRIVFTVPLHWKIEDTTLWIERSTKFKGVDYNLKSNIITIRVIDREGPWSQEDDDYYSQFPELSPETRMLNGYRESVQ